MSSSDKPEKVKRGVMVKEDKDGGQGGFFGTAKGFIFDIGEKIQDRVGFANPTADVTGIHIPEMNLIKADIVVDMLVKNPNPFPIPLVVINYLIETDGRKLLSGIIPDADTIHSHASETFKIPVSLLYDEIKSTYGDIQPGNIIPYTVKVDLIMDVPVFGRLTIPIEKSGKIPVPDKPDIGVDNIKFESFSMEKIVASLHLKLDNKNDFHMELNSLDYQFWLGDINVGGAKLSKSARIYKCCTTYIDLPISFRPEDFESVLWDMSRGRCNGYTMKGNIEVDTPFGPMKLPISREGGTTSLRKNEEDGCNDDDED